MLAALAPMAIFLAVVSGCSDSTTNTNPTYIDNPNVKTFDSIGVDEDSIANSYTGIDLLAGRTTTGIDSARDCSLQDRTNEGFDFYLQNGQFLNNLLAGGYEIRFFRVASDMSITTFDTLSKVPGYVSFVPQDFTADNTAAGNWGYFNVPLNIYPVYCFWLKGKREAGITSKDVYGIIQPREATDRLPNEVYGYRMSFRIRINTNGENDFRKQILQVP